jgi:hypothetical protein
MLKAAFLTSLEVNDDSKFSFMRRVTFGNILFNTSGSIACTSEVKRSEKYWRIIGLSALVPSIQSSP